MKKFLALLLSLSMVLALVACGGSSNTTTNDSSTTNDTTATDDTTAADDTTGSDVASEITLWTYPIGNWGDEASVSALTDAFEADTGIKVTVEYLTYTDGDDKVNTALQGGAAPDLIMEGPERLVANWGANGYMVDLSDMLDSTDLGEIYDSVQAACINSDGACYEYPLVMTAHCMAVNLDAFKEAGADQYLDLDTHTWTTEDFINAVNALYSYYGTTVGAVYCSAQGGDQGTRALVNNLYGGTFTNAEHTAYTWDDEANIKALQTLYDLDGIAYDASINGGEEIQLFCNGTLKMAFCWNIAQQLNPGSAGGDAGKTYDGDEIVFMSFPSETGESLLQGGIWGFGVFDNGDESKIAAAKEFIKYMCDSEHTADAVKTANYFAVRDTAEGADLTTIWADNDIMNQYTVLMPYLGDYYQVTTGWTEARAQWWNMLQQVGAGNDVASTVAEYCANANAAA
jgi:multiple sugar transport system substrate-binding protein